MDAAEYCLKYLAATVNLCIHYVRTKDGKIEGRELNILWDWVDADFAADLNKRRSHTSYVIMLNGGPISWKSVKQKSVSLSTTESECWYAAFEAGKELLYLRIIMREFGFPQLGPMHLYEDSRQLQRWQRTQVTERGRDTLTRVSISSTNMSKIALSSWCSTEPTRW
jgi:hypothetical protein